MHTTHVHGKNNYGGAIMSNKKMTNKQHVTSEVETEKEVLSIPPEETKKEVMDIREGRKPLTTKNGVVINCVSLYVRKTPDRNGEVITTIPKDTKVVINESKSTNEFCNIKTKNNVSGFCMRLFIKVD